MLWIQVFCSIWMTSLIYLIQWVHYPSFHYIDPSKSLNYAKFHQSRISLIVLPIMTVELFSLLYLLKQNTQSTIYILATILLVIIWLSTFLLQVPCHQQLLKTHDLKSINKLILTNWIRTIAWSIKTALLLYVLFINLK
eukprot:COSAG01_NODE_52_length_31456_cov_125.226648_28_plen_139_part_00